MKKIISIQKTTLFLALITIGFSCKKEESNDGSDSNSGSSSSCLTYVDQAATGDVLGNDFTFVEGIIKEDPFDSTKYRITLYQDDVNNTCNSFVIEDYTIIFSVDKATGKTEFEFGGTTLTFNDASVVNTVNADVSTCGYVDIKTLDNTGVSGELVAKGSESQIIGNFTADFCTNQNVFFVGGGLNAL
jgi:hypothetical protein